MVHEDFNTSIQAATGIDTLLLGALVGYFRDMAELSERESMPTAARNFYIAALYTAMGGALHPVEGLESKVKEYDT